MATPKRRKIDAPDGSNQQMSAASAFALRRQLLAGNATPSAPSTPDPTLGDIPMSPGPAATPAPRTRKANGPRSRKASEPPAEASSATGSGSGVGTADGAQIPLVGSSSAESLAAPSLPTVKQFSTFRFNKSNSRKLPSGVVQLKLSDSERFVLLGNYGIRVIRGEVTIAGATLAPSDAVSWVHAAQCHALPVLRSAADTKLELHPSPQAAGLRNLEKLSPLFRGLWNDVGGKDAPQSDTYQMIQTSNDIPRRTVVQELVAHPAWNKKLAELTAPRDGRSPVVFVTGPKSSGKSTFGRILGNKFFTSALKSSTRQSCAIAVLDLDLGQPEYGLVGTVGLVQVNSANLAPAFARPALNGTSTSLLRLHALAAVSPAQDPELYVDAALDLYHRYQQSPLRNRPLIVNTSGWILGTGLNLLTELISKINPTDVVYMSEDGPLESVDAISGAFKGTFATLPSQQAEFASRTAAHLRAMQTMSYFHAAADKKGEVSWNSSPLSTQPPLHVHYAGADAGILGVISYEFQPPAELLVDTINGSILALVEIEDMKALAGLLRDSDLTKDSAAEGDVERTVDYEPIISRSPEGIPFIPNPDSQSLDPKYCQCLGLVLLRGIDTANSQLQLLTPIPLARIQESRKTGRQLVLLHGKFDTPGWAYTEDSYARTFKQGSAGDDRLEAGNDEDEDIDEDTGREAADVAQEISTGADLGETPWVEVLRDNEKRPVGSRVWRVRRDLGKGGPGGD